VRARRIVPTLLLAVGALLAAAGPAAASPQEAGDQVALRALGLYLGPIDGEVGPEARAATEALQKRAGLPVTGVIGTRTRLALGPLGRPLFGTRPIIPGDFGLDVSALQFLLSREGFYHAALDGYFGRHLDAAVRAFQQKAHLTVDGIAGLQTLAAVVARGGAHPAPPHRIYVVQSGDSLTAIAARFGTTMARLAHLNHLQPAQVLLIGRRLEVPARPATVALAASRSDVQNLLDLWAGKLGVSPDLVRALAWMESGYQPNVVSSVGARGVLQVMPSTRAFVEQVLVGHPIPQTLDGDIEVGILYLRHLLGQFEGNTGLALGAWYQGERAVKQFGLYQMTKPFVTDVLALKARM